ncbi:MULTISPECIES: hypothetical protein [unclassified Rathayibacter]|uniref:hypothetical protein n=1 Tax=unclassified Rathayibacter TaxID=2609250 RepID=UPI00188CE9A4|nr:MULTISPECIES: hypothetical protein [unclassified Rathayibacter]MBF4463247.1 hypothetical protein [Rathayibacter sp. VKM Ac-2879]MBF4504516.1 hypothetical protein [Rathayibacter sp. VKM Ac-2878]
MYDALLPNVFVGIAVALIVVGTVVLFSTTDRMGKTLAAARRIVWGLGIMGVGAAFWTASLWVDGTGWLPGRIITTVIVVAGLAYASLRIPRIMAAARERDAAAHQAQS